jgi:hypothetical protein
MTLLLFHLDSRFFDLVYLLFRSLILFNNKFKNYTRLRVQPIVPVFDSGLLS